MNYARANLILEEISKEYPRGAGLVFLFMWDMIKDVFEDIEGAVDCDSSWGEYRVTTGTTLEIVWEHFNKNLWGGLDVEGSDVFEWLREEDFIIEADYVKESDNE